MADNRSQLHQGHRSRLRQEVRAVGMKGMSPHRALEYLLSFVIARKDTNELAHRLINTFGSFSGVLDASYEQLINVNGIGDVSASFLLSLKYIDDFYHAKSGKSAFVINTPIDAVNAVTNLIGKKTSECFVTIALDKFGKVLGSEMSQLGEDDNVKINVLDLYKFICRSNASRILLGHNHPNNNPTPSQNDIDFTNNTINSLKTLGVTLIDHVIVTPDGRHFSFTSHNLINMMQDGKKITTDMILDILADNTSTSEDK